MWDYFYRIGHNTVYYFQFHAFFRIPVFFHFLSEEGHINEIILFSLRVTRRKGDFAKTDFTVFFSIKIPVSITNTQIKVKYHSVLWTCKKNALSHMKTKAKKKTRSEMLVNHKF